MNFIGSGTKLTDGDIATIADELGVEEAALRAVLSVETGGSGFDKINRPKALFERHIFFRELKPNLNKQAKAVDQNLAYPKWGQMPYPKTSDGVYEEIDRACSIDEDAALASTSWGLGQIMGLNYQAAGCETVQEMVQQAVESETNQLRHMVNLMKSNGLVSKLANKDWAGFARYYNGPSYETNQYDKKLETAYNKFSDAA